MHRLAYYLGHTPDGRPLYRYRVPDERYERLREFLQRELRHRDLATMPTELQALFCLFSAEWWRREHAGGHWAWKPILEGLGICEQRWQSVTRAIAKGLRALDRPLIHRESGDRAFLVTVVCEGGLPMQLLQSEGTALRSYCREVLEHLEDLGWDGNEPVEELEGLAARYDDRLPKSLRRDIVHRLVGELVGRAWALRQEIEPGERDPIAALDRTVPDWRERLPLVLSDAAATALLRGLMTDMIEIARGGSRLRVRCQLALSSDSAQLRRFLELPSTVTTQRLRELLGDQELPEGNRLVLTLRAESGDTLRVGALGRAGDQTWASQPLSSPAFVGAEAEGMVTLLVASRSGVAREATDIDGGAALGALPWVFRPTADGPHRWDLVGTGSVKRREPELIVAVGDDLGIEGDGYQTLQTRLGDRRLFRVTGTLRVRTADGLVIVRASHGTSDIGTYDLRGRRFEKVNSPRTAWSGMPTLIRREGAREEVVSLEVHTDGRWRHAEPTDVGDLRVRARTDGELVFSTILRVVPDDLSLSLEVGDRGSPGVVVVRSRALEEAWIPPGEGYDVERVQLPGAVALELRATGAPPPLVPITLQFGFGRLQGRIPFPIVTTRFEAPDEETLPSGHSLHVKRLGGIRAVGLSPRTGARFRITLSAQLRGSGLVPSQRNFDLYPQPSGEQILDLREVQAAALDLLDATEQLDATIRIELWEVGASGRRAALNVRRYDWTLQRDESTGDVLLEGPDADELPNVTVEARPFSDIGEAEVLPLMAGEPRWRFDPEGRAAGSWLITAREEGWYRCRPIPFSAHGLGEPPSGLCALFELTTEGERHQAIAAHLTEMCTSWGHPDWKVIDGFLRLLGDLPATTFDLTRVVAADPMASAIVALRAASWPPADLIEVLEGFEELVFLWEAIPFETWLAAFDLLHDAIAPFDSETALSEVLSRGQTLGERLPTVLVALHHWAHRRDTNVPAPPGDMPVAMTFHRDAGADLLPARRSVAEDLIRHRGESESWPQPRGELPAVPNTLSIGLGNQPTHRRQVIDAPVLLALAAAGHVQPCKATALFLEEVRSFAPVFFRDAFLFTFFALIARDHGV